MEKNVGLFSGVSVEMIVAHSLDRVIGVNGKLPWTSIPEDFAYFRKITMGCPCIMGRNTYDSLPIPREGDGSPLPGRDLVVLSRRRRDVVKMRTYNVRRIPAALGTAAHLLKQREELFGEENRDMPFRIVVIGGEEIYARLFLHVDTVHVTTVETVVFPGGAPKDDATKVAHFPQLDISSWSRSLVMQIEERETPKGVIPGFRIEVFRRS